MSEQGLILAEGGMLISIVKLVQNSSFSADTFVI